MSEENKKPEDGQISRRSFLGKFGRIVGLAVVAVHMPFKAEAACNLPGSFGDTCDNGFETADVCWVVGSPDHCPGETEETDVCGAGEQQRPNEVDECSTGAKITDFCNPAIGEPDVCYTGHPDDDECDSNGTGDVPVCMNQNQDDCKIDADECHSGFPNDDECLPSISSDVCTDGTENTDTCIVGSDPDVCIANVRYTDQCKAGNTDVCYYVNKASDICNAASDNCVPVETVPDRCLYGSDSCSAGDGIAD